MKDKILIILELYPNITREDILNFELLKKEYVDVIIFDDLKQNPNIMNEYKFIYDCTINNNILNFVISNGAIKLIDNFTFYKFNNQNFIEGIAIQHFLITERENSFIPEELKNIKKNKANEFVKKLEFLKTHLQIKNTYEDVNKSFEQGLEYHSNGKKYIIAKKIPDIKEENVEYITNADIPIVKDILEILQYIKE